ncbi:MAG: hypothetical protein ABT940_12905, partial [Alphaproteobacteria bacterium]
KLVEEVRGGTALGKTPGLVVKTSQPFTRAGDPVGVVPTSLTTGLFSAAIGQVVQGPVEGGYAVAVLKSILPAEVAADGNAEVESLSRQIRTEMADDLAAQFVQALGKDFEITVNRKLLEETF